MSVLRPDELPTNVDRSRYLATVADLEQVGMLSAAATAWGAALEQWPGDPLALFGLGNTLLSLNQPEEAERIYRELVAARPDLVIARNNLAMALYRTGQLEEADKELRYILERDSVNFDALDGLGVVLIRTEKHQEALEYLKKAGWDKRGPDGIRVKDGKRLSVELLTGYAHHKDRITVE